MKKFTKNMDGHIIYDNSDNINTVRARKELKEKTKIETASITVMNRQVRRALDLIKKLESRIETLENQ